MTKQPFQHNLWETREEALAALEGPLRQEAEILQGAFALIDVCITQLLTRDTKYTRVCAVTMIKARNLELGCYSLALGGLVQEGGALFRPVVETLELLIYFWKDPARVDEAIEGNLLPAEKIAQNIEENFKGLRDFLNSHASHFSFTYESLLYIANLQNLDCISADAIVSQCQAQMRHSCSEINLNIIGFVCAMGLLDSDRFYVLCWLSRQCLTAYTLYRPS